MSARSIDRVVFRNGANTGQRPGSGLTAGAAADRIRIRLGIGRPRSTEFGVLAQNGDTYNLVGCARVADRAAPRQRHVAIAAENRVKRIDGCAAQNKIVTTCW